MDLDDILKGITIHKVTEEEKRFDKPVSLPFKDASKSWKTLDSGMDIAILEEELKGVIFKRVPLPMPDFETYRTIPSYSYQVKNVRDLDVVIVMRFNARNLRILPGAGFVLHNTTVQGILKAGSSGNVCTCEPENKRVDVFDPFNVDIMVYPASSTVKENDNGDCKLYTKTTYGNESTFDFEVYNGRDFEIEAEVIVEGDFGKKTFIQRVKPHEKAYVGQVRSIADISQAWKWQSAPGAIKPKVETRTLTSEAQGVFLTQNITNEAMNRNTLEINNTLSHAVHVEIDFVGTAQIDLMGNSRPLKCRIPAKAKQVVGTVGFKGDVSVSWGWKGEN